MKRCFVAMAIADSTREQLATLGAELRELPRAAARRLRPVKPDNLHVTIKFLGDTPDAQIADVIAALTGVCAHTAPTPVSAAGVGAFPTVARPRVVFAALGAGRDQVTELCVAIESALVPLGFDAERRAPHPHITLARIEGARPRGAITRWLDEMPERQYGPVAAAELILFESQLTSHGAIYQPLAAVPLGDA